MNGRGHRLRRWLGTWPHRDRLATRLAMGRRGYSSYRHLDLVPLPLVPQHHSTALPPPTRYEKRYEEMFLENKGPHQRPTRRWGATEDGEVGDTGYLTRFSANSEYRSITFSEPRECLLRASATLLMVRPPETLQGI